MIQQAVTITSTVRSKEHTVAIYDEYINEARANGDTTRQRRWENIRQRLLSGAQLSHTTGRKFDLVVSQGTLNKLSQWYDPDGIHQDIQKFFNNTKGLTWDFHAAHFDISLASEKDDHQYLSTEDINKGIANFSPGQKPPTRLIRAGMIPNPIPLAQSLLRPDSRPDQDHLETTLNTKLPVELNPQFSQVRLRSGSNPNISPRNIASGEKFSCPKNGIYKTGSELNLENSALAETIFLCIEDPHNNQYWIASQYLSNSQAV